MHKGAPRDACTYRKALVRTQQEDSIYKPRAEVSDQPTQATSWSLTSSLQHYEKITLLFKPPNPWYLLWQLQQTNTVNEACCSENCFLTQNIDPGHPYELISLYTQHYSMVCGILFNGYFPFGGFACFLFFMITIINTIILFLKNCKIRIKLLS